MFALLLEIFFFEKLHRFYFDLICIVFMLHVIIICQRFNDNICSQLSWLLCSLLFALHFDIFFETFAYSNDDTFYYIFANVSIRIFVGWLQ